MLTPGPRSLTASVDRLYSPLFDFAGIVEALLSSALSLRFGQINRGTPINLRCASFPYVVWIPEFTILSVILQSGKPKTITYRIEPPPYQPLSMISSSFGGVSVSIDFSSILGALLQPFFVSFFETHKDWIKQACGGNAYTWPTIFNFARVIRNAILHNEGRIKFDNIGAGPVNWHHLSYSPDQNGHLAVSNEGGDLASADILILMFEMSDELDRLGCPLNP
jgi:hypothetical protein